MSKLNILTRNVPCFSWYHDDLDKRFLWYYFLTSSRDFLALHWKRETIRVWVKSCCFSVPEKSDIQVFTESASINPQIPLWDTPARNLNSGIHHLGRYLFEECNSHDSLQARLIEGIGHFESWLKITLLHCWNYGMVTLTDLSFKRLWKTNTLERYLNLWLKSSTSTWDWTYVEQKADKPCS